MASTQNVERIPQQYNVFHVYLSAANGSRHPGTRAVEPAADSAQAVRGNLYAAVEIFEQETSEPSAEKSRLAERLLGLLQATYYSTKGSQSQVLTEAIQQAHQLLQELNARRPPERRLRASTMCISFLNGRLMLASSGPALSLLVTEQAVEQFPSQVDQKAPQLGTNSAPELQIIQRDVAGGGAFYVGSSSLLNHIPIRTLLGSLTRTTAENIEDVALYISQESQYAAIPGMLLLVEPATGRAAARSDERAGSHRPDSQSGPLTNTTSDSALPKRPSAAALPTSVFASPPVHTTPADDESTEEQGQRWSSPTPRRRAVRQEQNAEAGHDEAAAPTYQGGTSSDRSRQPQTAAQWSEDERVTSPESAGGLPGEALRRHATVGEDVDHVMPPSAEMSATESTRGTAADNVRQQLVRARAAVGEIINNVLPGSVTPRAEAQAASGTAGRRGAGRLVSPTAPAGDGQSRFEIAASVAGANAERLAQASATMTKAAVSGAAETVHRFEPPAPTSGSKARLFASIAVLIAILAPVVVASVVWQRGASSRAEGEQRYEQARADFLSASTALDAGDKAVARTKLTEAQDSLRTSQMLLGNQPKLTALAQEIERELQEVLQVWPLYKLVEPLVRFPAGAQPRRLLVVDQDIYVLDTGRDLVQRFRLVAESGQVEDEAGEVILSRGETVSGQNVSDLVDIAWQAPIPGIEDKANLLVLDSSNHVFRYNQRVEGAGILPFYGQESWQSPSQIEVYLGRVYVADGVSGQIYRYDPVNPGEYMEEPQPWLLTPAPGGLAGVQSMTIDGDIWLLFGDSKLLRYNQGEQAPFALDTAVGLISNPVDMFVGNLENSAIYVADAGQERILVYDKEGAYKRQLQAAEGNPLRDLSSIFIDDATQTIYILTQSALYQHPLPE